MKTVWVVCGPTASGKTRMAIDLALLRGAEILSADSRQIYKELAIGVARPEPEELARVPHHFIATHSIRENYTAGRFAREARAFLDAFFAHRNELVICGGTGLYIKALLEGIERLPVDEAIRQKVDALEKEGGLEGLAKEILQLDPELAAQTDLQNPRRVRRMLEWVLAGKPEHPAHHWPGDWQILKLAPEISREVLYQRINQRVDKMMEKGLWEEASRLFPFRELNALHTVGYQEIFEAMEGKLTRGEAIEKIKQHTRNYAKRQLTWFRKEEGIVWLPAGDQAALAGFAASQGNGTGSK